MEDNNIANILNSIIGVLHEDHVKALRRHWHDSPNMHWDNLIIVIDKALKENPQLVPILFVNEKCANIQAEVIAKTIKNNLLYGGDIVVIFNQCKKWYNEHGIQWTKNRLLEDKYLDVDFVF